jgi:hypothetical protein
MEISCVWLDSDTREPKVTFAFAKRKWKIKKNAEMKRKWKSKMKNVWKWNESENKILIKISIFTKNFS